MSPPSLAVLTNATLIKATESLSDWRKLGTYLDIEAHVLINIAKNHPGDAGRCRDAMVETWLHINPSATWKDVMKAVGKLPDVAIAQTIKNTSPDKGKPHPSQFHVYYERLSLSADLKLSTLLEQLHTISDWYLLGVYLGLPDTRLDQIKQECPCSTSDCLLKMLQFWLHNGSNISWSSLGEAIAKMPDVVCARNVEQQYKSSLQ